MLPQRTTCVRPTCQPARSSFARLAEVTGGAREAPAFVLRVSQLRGSSACLHSERGVACFRRVERGSSATRLRDPSLEASDDGSCRQRSSLRADRAHCTSVPSGGRAIGPPVRSYCVLDQRCKVGSTGPVRLCRTSTTFSLLPGRRPDLNGPLRRSADRSGLHLDSALADSVARPFADERDGPGRRQRPDPELLARVAFPDPVIERPAPADRTGKGVER